MTLSQQDTSNKDQKINHIDLKSELKLTLISEFNKNLKKSTNISEEQSKRLCNLLAREDVSIKDIRKALTEEMEVSGHDRKNQ